MTDASPLCLAILAAGASRRFGEAGKLTQALHGKMLGLHISDNLSGVGFGKKLVVARSAGHGCAQGWTQAGYKICENPDADDGMASSLAIAVRAAQASGCAGLLICLADMPFVPANHIKKLMEAFRSDNADDLIASSNGNAHLPPAIIGSGHFSALLTLTGDRGARELIAKARTIEASANCLADINDPETLARFNAAANPLSEPR